MRHVDCISQLRTRLDDSTNTCSLLNLISFNYITIKRRQFLLLTRSNLAILYNIITGHNVNIIKVVSYNNSMTNSQVYLV